MNTKYICLDVGNVICKVDFTDFTKQMAELLNITPGAAWQFLVDVQPAHDSGLVYIDEALAQSYMPSKAVRKQLVEEWNKTVVADPRMLAWMQSLLEKEVEIALLSNMGWEHAAIIDNILTPKIYEQCQSFLSCNMKVRKPMSEYYQIAFTSHQKFKGSVYLDDRPENIEAGLKAGLNAHLFDLDKETANLEKRLAEIETLVLA
jgi:FMN phosphatase YigB (HAD superfamily)